MRIANTNTHHHHHLYHLQRNLIEYTGSPPISHTRNPHFKSFCLFNCFDYYLRTKNVSKWIQENKNRKRYDSILIWNHLTFEFICCIIEFECWISRDLQLLEVIFCTHIAYNICIYIYVYNRRSAIKRQYRILLIHIFA